MDAKTEAQDHTADKPQTQGSNSELRALPTPVVASQTQQFLKKGFSLGEGKGEMQARAGSSEVTQQPQVKG